MLLVAALLHDVGKPATTRKEDNGRIRSPAHGRVGAILARRLLWEMDCPLTERERIARLVALHQLPFLLLGHPRAERLAVETSHRIAFDDLALLARADALGRICNDQAALLERVELAREYVGELGCLDHPWPFYRGR